MGTGQTTTSQIASAKTEFFDRVLLKRALPYLVHDNFGQRKPLPTGNSKDIKFRKYNAFATATTPLTEGVTPETTQLSKTDITATIQQYGAVTEITDVVDATNVESVLTEASEILGEQAGESVDEITRDYLVAGTSVLYTGTAAARNEVIEAINTTTLKVALRVLGNNLAKRHTNMIKAGVNIGTVPIRPAYFAIIHTDVLYDLDDLDGFIPVEKYASQGSVHEGEVGAYKNIRFIETTKAKVWEGAGGVGQMKQSTGGQCDVYATLIFGKDAYGITELRGQGMKTYFKDFGSSGTADPLNQRATKGWKATTVTKILNDNFMLRIESSASN